MDNFQDQTAGLKTMDTKPSDFKLKDIKVDLNRGRRQARKREFMSEVNRMAQTSQSGGTATLALRMQTFEVDTGIMNAELGIAPDAETKLLNEAKVLINEAKFKEALVKLAELLNANPQHIDGIFLRSVCHFRLEQIPPALKTLHPLSSLELTKRMTTRVRELRAEIRQKLKRQVMGTIDGHLRAKQYDKAEGVLRELLVLDPQGAVYYYLLGGTQMKQGRAQEAMQTIETGLAESDGDERELLEGLKADIGELLLRQLDPARESFKRKRFKKALSQLQELSEECRSLPLCKSFEAYVAPLAESSGFLGIKKSTPGALAKPTLSNNELVELWEFICEPEINEAKKHLESEQFGKAESLLAPLTQLFGEYPELHFLYAYSIYKNLVNTTNTGKQFSFDDLVNRLELAERHIEVGARDKSNTDADNLHTEIVKVLEVVRIIKQKLNEAIIVNGAVHEFMGYMQSIQGGQITQAQALAFVSNLRGLDRRLPGLIAQVQSPEALEIMNALKTATATIIRQIDSQLR